MSSAGRIRATHAARILTLTSALAATALVVLSPAPASAAAPRCDGRTATIIGTAGSDTLEGTSGPDVIWGGAGGDLVRGGGGDDVICGGPGGDGLEGGADTDRMLGGGGRDRLDVGDSDGDLAFGEGGPDVLYGDATNALLDGGGGDDFLATDAPVTTLNGGSGDDELVAQPGNASVDLEGGPGSDTLTGSDEADGEVDGGGGRDRIEVGDGDDGTDEVPVTGGPGNDVIVAGGGADHVDGGPGKDTVSLGTGGYGIGLGGEGDDRLTSRQVGSVLDGEAGNDVVVAQADGMAIGGGDGDDELLGEQHGDTMDGGAGDDVLRTGPTRTQGQDRLRGGPGRDVLHLTADGSLGFGDEDADRILTIGRGTRADGGDGDDVVEGGRYADVVLGGEGADSITGGAGDDDLDGGTGNDLLAGGEGQDRLLGGEGADVCRGGSGADVCDGGPLGTDQPTPDDPDICADDVETRINCRGGSLGDWFGSAQGTLSHGDGVTETWSATATMAEDVEDFLWSGPATIAWTISGTDAQGCTHQGGDTLDGRAALTIWRDLGTYDLELYRTPGETVDVTVTCPGREPVVEVYQPLNTNAAEASGPLPEPPVRTLEGSASYTPTNAPAGLAGWTWSFSTGA